MCAGYTSSSKQIAFDDYTHLSVISNPGSAGEGILLDDNSERRSVTDARFVVLLQQLRNKVPSITLTR